VAALSSCAAVVTVVTSVSCSLLTPPCLGLVTRSACALTHTPLHSSDQVARARARACVCAELKPQQPTKWHEECIEMVGQCRNCVTQAIKAI
jgi:hypothetical protein